MGFSIKSTGQRGRKKNEMLVRERIGHEVGRRKGDSNG